jgi:hypothetical protein
MSFARALGGAVVFVGANDGQALDQPLNPLTVREVLYLKALSKADLQPLPQSMVRDLNSADFGKPELYQCRISGDAGTEQVIVNVHHTRLVRFDGVATTARRRAQNQGWGDSVFRQVEETIMLFWGSMQGLANALSDADQAVFKLDGLMDIIKSSSDGDDAIRKRLALLQHGRSVARAIAVDAEKENFEYIGRTFTGYDTGVYALMYLVSAACGIPVSLLFGRAPAGLNATGDADIRFFYDQIKSFQEVTLMPRLRRVFELLMTAKLGPMGGVVPDDWSISFRSLWQPTALERADIRLKTAQADQIEIDANVITSEEARLSHYSGDEYNEHISIDMAVDPEAEAADRYEQQQTQVAQPQQAQIDPSKSPAGDNPDSPE